jgi:hypothetical protein
MSLQCVFQLLTVHHLYPSPKSQDAVAGSYGLHDFATDIFTLPL